MLKSIPLDNHTRRMAPLARLPLFFALLGKRVIVAGGTPAAAWKVELLSTAGATVDVYTPMGSEELLAIAGSCGSVTIHPRDLQAADIAGAALAVGACENDADASRFAVMARAAGVPVNVIDRPDFCDFSFGAVVNRSPLVIGISTDGAAPVFAQAIRAKLETLIPVTFARWAEAARRFRPGIQALGLSFRVRRRFWDAFTRAAVARPDCAPDPADANRWFADATCDDGRGSLVLIPVASNDPDMLTLRAVRALHVADVIVVDDGVSDAVLDFARREARKLVLGRSPDGTTGKPDDIDALTIRLAKQGKHVVRLVGGETANSEIEVSICACRRGRIPVDVVGFGQIPEPSASEGEPAPQQRPA
jgi:uroporphyrin-III C-methyltransferase/precorrin-2 dehydrogenase/sirohydrochlorin ferrochelatase